MTLEANWNATARTSESDILRINMTVELPVAFVQDVAANTVATYFSMSKKGGFGKVNYETVFCETTPTGTGGNATQAIAHFNSETLILTGDYTTWKGLATTFEQPSHYSPW